MSWPGRPPHAPRVLAEVEGRLDPAHPQRVGLEVLAYGEVSCALLVPGLEGWVAKRMAGLRDDRAAQAYLALLADYLLDLAAAGVRPVPTHAVLVARPGRGPVVYLLQPRLPTEGLGATILRDGPDAALAEAIEQVLDRLLALVRADAARGPGNQVAVDGQLSNWWFPGPLLLDVGTPFVRRGGRQVLDQEVFLSAVPALLRGHYRRTGEVAAYIDDYFQPRLVALDLLGNFHKEGRPDRIPLGLAVVNAWLSRHADDLGRPAALTPDEVAAYYAKDVDALELFLRVRRADRWSRRLLGVRYDFVLPGRIPR